jgi:Helicase conserved C-terminal domain
LGLRALSQKEQMQVMEQFRAGACNTLIGTCVIEEGIDVCDVDLIVTFDISSKNPTRFVQRMGRTGRKRMGHVLLLVTEGKEHKVVKDVLASKDKTNQKLGKSTEILRALYKDAPRLVPPEFNPKCVETFIKPKPAVELVETNKKNKKTMKKKLTEEPTTTTAIDEMSPVTTKKRTKRPKKAPVGVQDVRNFFKPTQTTDAGGGELVPNCPPTSTPTTPQNLSSTRLDTPTRPEGLDAEWKKLKNIYTTFEKSPTTNTPVLNPGISSLISSDQLSANAKKQVLLLNPGFVEDRLSAFKALGTLGDLSDCVMLEDDGGVGQMRIDVDLINSIFGGSTFVEDFLRQHQKSSKLRKPLAPFDVNQITELKESFVSLKSKMRADNKAKTGEKNNAEGQQPGTQVFAQTQYVLPDFISNESRYSKQPQSSVPQTVDKTMFKTPKRLEAGVATSTPKPIGQAKSSLKSPLIDAFRRMEERSKPKTLSTKLGISDTLNYFLLDSIDDMFEKIVDDKASREEVPTAVDAPDATVTGNVQAVEVSFVGFLT